MPSVPNDLPSGDAADGQNSQRTAWSQRYGQKHRLERIRTFPDGIQGPRRVRIYRRCDHYVLQWWDPGTKKTQSARVDGDLIDAISRARQIDERIEHCRTSGHCSRRVGHRELVDSYLVDLARRADAGEIDPRTVRRYASALTLHYLGYSERTDIERQFRYIAGVDRDFALGFATYLKNVVVRPNGHPNCRPRSMQGQAFVVDVVRGMYEWAADPDRGGLLPDAFRNPFVRRGRQRGGCLVDQFGEPDITISMATDFIRACDLYQLKLFAPLIFFGLRPSELCFLFREQISEGWLRVSCQPDLAYQTKGRRDKRLPLVTDIAPIIAGSGAGQSTGLLYLRRRVVAGREKAPLCGMTRANLVAEFDRRRTQDRVQTATGERQIRDAILREAGGINYDHVIGEFAKLQHRLQWPGAATLKDFRHLYSTCLENAGVPEFYRRYLLGQSPGRAAIVTYTHLNKIKEHYQRAIDTELKPLVEAVACRRRELDINTIDISEEFDNAQVQEST